MFKNLENVSKEEIEEMLGECDSDGDGGVNYEGFIFILWLFLVYFIFFFLEFEAIMELKEC